jgi:hypothetical protein
MALTGSPTAPLAKKVSATPRYEMSARIGIALLVAIIAGCSTFITWSVLTRY